MMLPESPFKMGQQYKTQGGQWVRFVSICNEGTDYETMADEFGVHRYTRRDFGRVTGGEWNDRCVPPPWPKVLGYEFKSMDRNDWDGYAGAEPGTLIHHAEWGDLLWHPASGVLSEIYFNLEETRLNDGMRQRDWTFQQVL